MRKVKLLIDADNEVCECGKECIVFELDEEDDCFMLSEHSHCPHCGKEL